MYIYIAVIKMILKSDVFLKLNIVAHRVHICIRHFLALLHKNHQESLQKQWKASDLRQVVLELLFYMKNQLSCANNQHKLPCLGA